MRKILVFLFLVILKCIDSSRILIVFPYPSQSHVNLAEGFVKTLLQDGHEITYITIKPIKNPPMNLRQINVSSLSGLLPPGVLTIESFLNPEEFDMKDIKVVLELVHNIVNTTLHHEAIQEFIMEPGTEFDLVIAEWLYSELYSGFSAVFNCPYIWCSSMDPHWMALRLVDERSNPAYTSDLMIPSTTPYDFVTRVRQLWMQIRGTFVYDWLIPQEESYRSAFGKAVKARGRELPSFDEIRYNASLMFSNSHVSLGEPHSLPQNFIQIGGYHMQDDVAPLSEDLERTMNKSKNGVIYFSMGSMINTDSMPGTMKTDLIQMFSKLKYTVVWKSGNFKTRLPDNVYVLEWAPQQSILAHPNTKLFITHGGLLSTTEAVHYGIPLIGIPGFADQHLNVERARNKGFAEIVNLALDLAKPLKNAIEKVMGNPRYTEKVKELSAIYHDRPLKPREEICYWVRHVLKTRGATHLRSSALMTPWYQKMYLDLLAVIFTVVVLIIIVITKLDFKKKTVNAKKKKM